MVARRKRRREPELDEHGFPIMKGVDMSMSEDPAIFWGPNWEQELEEAIAEAKQGGRKIYYTLEEFFAALHDEER